MKRSKHHHAREPACARKALLTTAGTIFVPFIFLLLLAWKSAKNEIFRVGPFQVAKCTFDTRACEAMLRKGCVPKSRLRDHPPSLYHHVVFVFFIVVVRGD